MALWGGGQRFSDKIISQSSVTMKGEGTIRIQNRDFIYGRPLTLPLKMSSVTRPLSREFVKRSDCILKSQLTKIANELSFFPYCFTKIAYLLRRYRLSWLGLDRTGENQNVSDKRETLRQVFTSGSPGVHPKSTGSIRALHFDILSVGIYP